MLLDRLEKGGYKVMYVQPVYLLLNILTRLKYNDVTPISPRKTRTSQINDSDKNRKKNFSRKLFIGLLGYPYALITYMFMKFTGRNKIIICDRYFYQFFFDLFGGWSESMLKVFPKPYITFFLDGDLDLFYLRMNDTFDTSVGRDYYTNVLNLYRKLSQKYGFVQIDANLNKEAINDIIFMYLTKEVKGGRL